MSYTSCPACSAKRSHRSKHHHALRICTRCNAIYGELYLGDSYAVVSPHFTTDQTATERQRYFDFAVLGSAGVTRRHGWYDPTTKLLTQVG